MRRSSEPIRDRDEAGFTLIELLVTLAVLAVSITAIGALMATNNRGTLALDQRLAMVEATRAVLTGLPDRSQLRPGTLSGEYNYHRWQVDTQPLVADFIDPRRADPVDSGIRRRQGEIAGRPAAADRNRPAAQRAGSAAMMLRRFLGRSETAAPRNIGSRNAGFTLIEAMLPSR